MPHQTYVCASCIQYRDLRPVKGCAREDENDDFLSVWLTIRLCRQHGAPHCQFGLVDEKIDAFFLRRQANAVDDFVISSDAKHVAGAEKLLSFPVSDPGVQAKWAGNKGTRSAGVSASPDVTVALASGAP